MTVLSLQCLQMVKWIVPNFFRRWKWFVAFSAFNLKSRIEMWHSSLICRNDVSWMKYSSCIRIPRILFHSCTLLQFIYHDYLKMEFVSVDILMEPKGLFPFLYHLESLPYTFYGRNPTDTTINTGCSNHLAGKSVGICLNSWRLMVNMVSFKFQIQLLKTSPFQAERREDWLMRTINGWFHWKIYEE